MTVKIVLLTLLIIQCTLIGFCADQAIHGIDQLVNLILITVNISGGALNLFNLTRV
jgi:hypothetical protein